MLSILFQLVELLKKFSTTFIKFREFKNFQKLHIKFSLFSFLSMLMSPIFHKYWDLFEFLDNIFNDYFAQSAGTVKYIDCTSAERYDHPPNQRVSWI